jgi:hypothetical protein
MIGAVTTIDVLAALGGFCALLMVAWALFLIQTGILTLQQAARNDKDTSDALNVEVQKALKVRVQSSVIALFVVALGFLGLSFYFVQTNSVRPMLVIGEIQSDDNTPASIRFSTQWSVIETTGGEVRNEIWPKVDQIELEIATPGHEPGRVIRFARPDKDHGGDLYFTPVKVGKKILDKPEAGPLASPPAPLAPVLY